MTKSKNVGKRLNKVQEAIDFLGLLDDFINNSSCSLVSPPAPQLKHLINRWKKLKSGHSNTIKGEIKSTETKVRPFYHSKKAKHVKRLSVPENCNSLWKPVMIAKI